MDKYNFHPTLTRSFVKPDWPEEDVLVWMILLHLHKIVSSLDVSIDEAPNLERPLVWDPETRRGAAASVATVWPATDKRSNPVYWSSLYDLKSGYEDISEMPPAMVEKMIAMRELLKGHPMVLDVTLET